MVRAFAFYRGLTLQLYETTQIRSGPLALTFYSNMVNGPNVREIRSTWLAMGRLNGSVHSLMVYRHLH